MRQKVGVVMAEPLSKLAEKCKSCPKSEKCDHKRIDATGGTIWDLEKYAFENKTYYDLIDKFYEPLLLEAQNKVIDSYFRYLEKKREPKERFYMPRRKQFLKIGLTNALQGMIDDIALIVYATTQQIMSNNTEMHRR